MWVVVVVGLVAFVIGGGIGAAAGYAAGVASQVMDFVQEPTAPIGDDAATASGPVDAGRIDVGQFAVTELDIRPDFADDFIANLTVTNEGPSFGGGAIEIEFFAGPQALGQVSGSVPPLDAGESTTLEVWGFDGYDAAVDRVEIRIG